MQSSRVRILLVEDSEYFQVLITSILQERPNAQLVGVVSDGVEAVRRAKELQPDLILLDICLPKMNGVKAAREIRAVAPESRIVFVSQETSAGVVKEAIKLGAWGYVVKSYVRCELIRAMDAVLQGRQFIGSGVTGDDLTNTEESLILMDRRRKAPATDLSGMPREPQINGCHEVQFYSENGILLNSATRFIEAAIRRGHPVVVSASTAFRGDLRHALGIRHLDIDSLAERGRYVSLDAAETVSTFMVNDIPDPIRFAQFLGGIVALAANRAKGDHPRVAIYQECASLLWARGNVEAAMRVEQFSNELASKHNVDILCSYPVSHIHGEEDDHLVHRICAEHSAVHSW